MGYFILLNDFRGVVIIFVLSLKGRTIGAWDAAGMEVLLTCVGNEDE